MFSAFRVGPVASGRGLCDINRVFYKGFKSHVRKLGSPSTAKIYRLQSKPKNPNYRYIFVVLTYDLAILNNALSISHGPRPPTAGLSGNAKINAKISPTHKLRGDIEPFEPRRNIEI